MKKFWNQPIEFKALIISSILTVLGFGGTMFLFWFQRYDIPFAVLTSGVIVSSTWLFLFLNKRSGKNRVKLDIVFIYLRIILIVGLTILFAALELGLNIVTVSPVYLVISYIVISMVNLLAYFTKGENNV